MALGSTQSPTQKSWMSPGGIGGWCVELTTFMCRVSRNSGSLNFLDSECPVQACNGIGLPSPLHSAVCVLCPLWLIFYSSLILCRPEALLMYCMNNFEKIPVSPHVTGITSIFTFLVHCISIARSLTYLLTYLLHGAEPFLRS